MKIRLYEVRVRKCVLQSELSERTGIAVPTISRIEHGLQTPRLTTIRKLAAALGVEPSELMEEREEP